MVGSPIQIYNKLSVNEKTIYSTGAKGSANHDSTKVLFRPTLPPCILQYGQVVCFIVCPSSLECDSAHFAVIKALQTEPYQELDYPCLINSATCNNCCQQIMFLFKCHKLSDLENIMFCLSTK